MKLHILILLVLVFSTINQTQAQKRVRWNSPDLPASCCSNYYNDGKLVTTFKDENIYFTVTLNFDDKNDLIVFAVGMINYSDKSISFDPSEFSLRMTEPVNKTQSALDSAEAGKKIKDKGKWQMFFKTMAAGMATKQTTGVVTDDQGRQATVTVTEPNTEAASRVREERAQRSAENENKLSAMDSVILKRHTIFPKGDKVGLVFFDRKKLGDGMVLSIKLGETTYEIPYGKDRKSAQERKQ